MLQNAKEMAEHRDDSGSPSVAGQPRGNGDQVSDAPRRGRGRPKGSRSKLGNDARAILAAKGPRAVEMLVKLASGRAVTMRDRDKETGQLRRIVPSAGDVLFACKILLSKLVPDLKAQEISGPDGEPLFAEPKSNRELAMSVLTLLRGAHAEGPENIEAEAEEVSDWTPAIAPDLAPPPRAEAEEAAIVLADCNGAVVQLTDTRPDGAQRWSLFRCDGHRLSVHRSREAAEAHARALHQERRI